MALELESTLQEDAASIRVALVPVGGTDGPSFRRLASLIHPHTCLDLFGITHGQRHGTLRLRFLQSGGGPSEWEELYPQRRVRAVVGLCHSPSEDDLGGAFRAFMRRVEAFPATAQVRCLVFDSAESSQSLAGLDALPASDMRRIVIVPPKPRSEVGMHMERLLEDLGSDLLRDLKAEADTGSAIMPSTPVDASSSLERSPMLRLLSSGSGRLSARHLKRRGDFRLMDGLADDAKQAYERAIELLSRTGADAVWHAAALEGAAAASLILLTPQQHARLRNGAAAPPVASSASSDADESGAYDEALGVARRRLEEAASLCVTRGGRACEVAVEIGFRLARLIGESAERERARLAMLPKDLMGAEGGELPPPPSPWRGRRIEASQRLHRQCFELAVASDSPLGFQLQLRACLAAASLSTELGQHRKSVFYLVEAARRFRDNLQWHAAHEVLLVAAPLLQLAPLQWLQLRAQWRPPVPSEPPQSARPTPSALAERVPVYRMVHAATSGWSHLREVVLAMLLEAAEATSDEPLCASYALFTLRLMASNLPDSVQLRLVSLIEQSTASIHPPIAAPAIGLPWLLALQPVAFSPERVPHKRGDESGGGARGPAGERSSSVFMFSPFEARRQREASAREAARVRWVHGERVVALARIANPLCVPLRIDFLALHARVEERNPAEGAGAAAKETARFVPCGVPLVIPPRCAGVEVELSGRVEGGDDIAPDGESFLVLVGVESRAYGAVCVHPVDSEGAAARLQPSAYAVKVPPPLHTHSTPHAAELNGNSGDGVDDALAEEQARWWQPPPPLEIPLAPPMPLLQPPSALALLSGSTGDLHPGQRTTLSVALTNMGMVGARSVHVELQLPANATRITRRTGFNWYDVASPIDLFDEEECDGASMRSHIEVSQAEVDVQLPLAPGRTLELPIRVSATGEGACTCEMRLSYGADIEVDRSAADGSHRWLRRLSIPLRVPVAGGLVLSDEVTVQHDPHMLYLLTAGVPSPVSATGAAPGCLLMLHVRNTHEHATFELTCELGSALAAPHSAHDSVQDEARRDLQWILPPGSSRRLLLPLCCIDASGPHPLPDSQAMLESFLSQCKPAVAPAEASAMRRAHLLKAVLLTSLRLDWRRLGGSGESGMLPLAPLRLGGPQLSALCRPPVVLHASLTPAQPPSDPKLAILSPIDRELSVRLTNVAPQTLSEAVIRVRAVMTGGAAARRAVAARPAPPASSPKKQTSPRTPHSHRGSMGAPVVVGAASFEGETPSRSRISSEASLPAAAPAAKPPADPIPTSAADEALSPLHLDLQFASSDDASSGGALPWPAAGASNGGSLPAGSASGGGADALADISEAFETVALTAAPPIAPSAATSLAVDADREWSRAGELQWRRAEVVSAEKGGAGKEDAGAEDDDANSIVSVTELDGYGEMDELADGICWNGALDALVPTLAQGEVHEHIVGVGCRDPGRSYRLSVDCFDRLGAGDLISSTFVDLLPQV